MPQSMISHTLWLWFLYVDKGEDEVDELSLSLFVLDSHLKLKGKREDRRYKELAFRPIFVHILFSSNRLNL